MNPGFKAIAVTLLAGAIAGSMTSCSKDLPTEPAHQPLAGGAQPSASLQARPPNDGFDRAVVITALPFTHTVNTSRATTAADDPNVEDCGFGDHTVWYRFTPTENLRIIANTVRSRPDQGISLFTGTRGNLSRIACSFVYGTVGFDAIAGTTYHFMIGSPAGEPGGDLVFAVDRSIKVSVRINREGSINPETGVATIRGRVTCSQPAFFEGGGWVQQQRGSVLVTGSYFITGDCDGVTHWEAEAVADDWRFVSGRAEVSGGVLFTADATTEERHGTAKTITVRLRR
jgi:hypothetical protein